ncbi:Hexokinase [Mucinivorans hirudinis]|uniref:Hexokinase n=1 Tax=Mucinivorans hirudinis TaxID=1433126 RepID=A0A060R9F6_9BACT|nr:Hexokinase [Mucinivorans hirudinis]
MKNEFELTTEQLIEIANDLDAKIYRGLTVNGTEIKCIPTYVKPCKNALEGEAVAFDLGGTNFRAAKVRIGEHTDVLEDFKKNFEHMKEPRYTREDLFEDISNVADKLDIADNASIGYCFSYPSESTMNGDAELIEWTKGVNIDGMIGKPIGQTLLDYLNEKNPKRYSKVVVINDTIATLFAGLSTPHKDAYIGLIVGTGTNMATIYPSSHISKIKNVKSWKGETPVNLESGNFNPPHLTKYDNAVDAKSEKPGAQRFEKAISGMYIGRVFLEVFPEAGFEPTLSGKDLNFIINNPTEYTSEQVEVAYQINVRSAKLVAASIAGLVSNLAKVNANTRNIMLLAEGTMFWSKAVYKDFDYKSVVHDTLRTILRGMGYEDINVDIPLTSNANLIGSAVAVLS